MFDSVLLHISLQLFVKFTRNSEWKLFYNHFCSSFIIYIVHIRIMVYEFWNRTIMIPSDTTAIILFDLFLLLFMKCTKLCLQKPHGNIVILYSIMIISYSFHDSVCYWSRDCEWMRCNAIIYHCMSWVICFSRLFIHDLFTNNAPVSIRPPPNQMQFCCFYSQLEHLSLSLSFSGSSFSSVWPEQHARSSHDTLRGLFVRTQARKRELVAAETKKHLAVLMHFV